VDICLSWSLQSITEQLICPHWLPMQYWLKNQWPHQAFFKHFPHTHCISSSAIWRNNYISLLSDLCTCIHVKKKWCRKGNHSFSAYVSYFEILRFWDFCITIIICFCISIYYASALSLHIESTEPMMWTIIEHFKRQSINMLHAWGIFMISKLQCFHLLLRYG